MKKKISLICFSLFIIMLAQAQPGQWTWVNGVSTTNYQGMAGTKGVASPNNTPLSHYSGCNWIDSNKNLWIYGGYNAGDALWKYDVSVNQWTWVNGATNSNYVSPFMVLKVFHQSLIPLVVGILLPMVGLIHQTIFG
ncbi:MAG: hypothetical protein IPO27_13945 [Bacteroidetes bacterium]|nr:hypothetical protein [Bacteroidota bacterium]